MSASEQIRQNRHRCMPHLAKLRMLAHDPAAPSATSKVVREITRATNAIMAEATAGYRTALVPAADSSRGSGNPSLLQPRLARLQAAAEDTVAAASHQDAAALRQHVRRFESLTSAIWAVLLSAVAPARARTKASTGLAAGPVRLALAILYDSRASAEGQSGEGQSGCRFHTWQVT